MLLRLLAFLLGIGPYVAISEVNPLCTRDLRPFIDLIESFLNDQICSLTFEREYLHMFKNDVTEWPEDEYAVLNNLFGDVDAFCADPVLRDPDDLDEQQLKQSARIALEKLSVLAASS